MKVRDAVIAAFGSSIMFGLILYEIFGTGIAGPTAAQPETVPPAITAQAAADPVGILAKMHVPMLSGEVYGQADLEGDRYAIASFPDGEQVAVYTFADQTTQNADIARNGAPNDAHRLLVGHLFDVWVTGVDTGSGIGFPESPAVLAQESGAAVRQP